jgi:ankyrin repeat protein
MMDKTTWGRAEILRLFFFGGTTRFHRACSYGDEARVRQTVLGRPQLIDAPDLWGVSPIEYACIFSRPTVVTLLLSHGATVSCGTALCSAVATGNEAVVDALVSAGVDVNARSRRRFGGSTALHVAAATEQIGFVYYLSKMGADANVTDLCGRTPLHYAATCGNIDLCEALLRIGADRAVADGNAIAPWEVARNAGFTDIARTLRT